MVSWVWYIGLLWVCYLHASGLELRFLLSVFLRKHSNRRTELESEGNFIARQITHYLRERVIELMCATKGADICPFWLSSDGLK